MRLVQLVTSPDSAFGWLGERTGTRGHACREASIMTISASTVAPIAMAMPPRLMMVEGMSSRHIGMNESATTTGNVMSARR